MLVHQTRDRVRCYFAGQYEPRRLKLFSPVDCWSVRLTYARGTPSASKHASTRSTESDCPRPKTSHHFSFRATYFTGHVRGLARGHLLVRGLLGGLRNVVSGHLRGLFHMCFPVQIRHCRSLRSPLLLCVEGSGPPVGFLSAWSSSLMFFFDVACCGPHAFPKVHPEGQVRNIMLMYLTEVFKVPRGS